MLLSNLTKVESISSSLLALSIPVSIARVPASTFPQTSASHTKTTLPKYLPKTGGQVAWFLPSARAGSAVPPRLLPTTPTVAAVKEQTPAEIAKIAADHAAASAAALVPTAIGEEAPYVPEPGEMDPSLEFGNPSAFTEEEVKREVRYETLDAVRAIPLLLDAFVEGSEVVPALGKDIEKEASESAGGTGEGKRRKGNCHFLASVFANVTIVSNVRIVSTLHSC